MAIKEKILLYINIIISLYIGKTIQQVLLISMMMVVCI
jgi:hypothetical protein